MAPSQFRVGQRVMFDNGRKGTVYGTVRRVNPKTISLEQCSDGPRGWRVHPWMLSPADARDPGATDWSAPVGERPWSKGDRVEFTNGNRVVVGTIDRVNSKTCSIIPDVPDRPGQYWRVPPRALRPAGANSGKAPEPPDTTERDRARWESACGLYGLPKDAFGKTFTVRGTEYRIAAINTRRPKFPVSAVRVRDDRGFKFGADTVRRALGVVPAPAPKPPAPKPRRPEAEVLEDIVTVYNKLSPEYLTCDGELSKRQVASRKGALRARLEVLFAELGRTVDETAAWDRLAELTD